MTAYRTGEPEHIGPILDRVLGKLSAGGFVAAGLGSSSSQADDNRMVDNLIRQHKEAARELLDLAHCLADKLAAAYARIAELERDPKTARSERSG